MLTDENIADLLRASNQDFKLLEEKHQDLDMRLRELLKNHLLTPEEELSKKNIQKEKLGIKDRMAELIRSYRKG